MKYFDREKDVYNLDKAYKVALKSKDLDKIFVVEIIRRDGRKMSLKEVDRLNESVKKIFKIDVDMYNLEK